MLSYIFFSAFDEEILFDDEFIRQIFLHVVIYYRINLISQIRIL
jgi:hypothetical protein